MVALPGEAKGWIVEVASADEAIDIVHGTGPRAREAGREELLVWTERYYRDRYRGPRSGPHLAGRTSI